MDLRRFARYVGYILQDQEIEVIRALIDEDRIKKEQDKEAERERARKLREDREARMREEGKL